MRTVTEIFTEMLAAAEADDQEAVQRCAAELDTMPEVPEQANDRRRTRAEAGAERR